VLMFSKITLFSHIPRSYRLAYSIATRSLSGKTALVTGSTSGIGLGMAEAVAKNGANVVLNGFGEASNIRATQLRLEKENAVRVHYHSADMSKPDQIRDMVRETVQLFGGLDILVNNAGIQFVSPVDQFPDEKWDAIISINLSSAFHTIKATVPSMKNKGWGRIINTSSVHGLVASKNKSAYVTSKHGIIGLTKCVALELAGTGITANCINPGWVLTPLVEAQIRDKAQVEGITLEEAQKLILREKQPSEQFATVEQLGALLVFLCSPAADQITGISVPVDGGWTAQ